MDTSNSPASQNADPAASAGNHSHAGKALPPPRPTPAARFEADLNANVAARNFLERYQGAVIRYKLRLGNRVVVRLFRRGYAISVRNWYIATTVPRTAIGDNAMSQAVEVAMLAKLSGALKAMDTEIGRTNALLEQESFDKALLSHPDEFRDDQCPAIGPVAMQLLRLYVRADTLVDNLAALYALSVLDQEQHSGGLLQLKRDMEGVAASIRNHRFATLTAVNKAGSSRPGFSAIPQNDERKLDDLAPEALRPALAQAAADAGDEDEFAPADAQVALAE